MKRTDLPHNLRLLLRSTRYVTIATVCSNGHPWNTPVVGCFDDDLHLYWVSWRQNQHSQNIAHDPRIFVVVYDTAAPEGAGEGLYMQMYATPLETSKEVAAASKWYDVSFFRMQRGQLPTFVDDCPSRMYKAKLQKAWYNADGRVNGHFVDVRHEIIPLP